MTRSRLPNRREIEHLDLVWSKLRFSVGLGCDVGSTDISEVFLSISKAPGSAMDSAARDIAVLMSLALQHGCPPVVMADALTKSDDGSPEGLAGVIAELIVASASEIQP